MTNQTQNTNSNIAPIGLATGAGLFLYGTYALYSAWNAKPTYDEYVRSNEKSINIGKLINAGLAQVTNIAKDATQDHINIFKQSEIFKEYAEKATSTAMYGAALIVSGIAVSAYSAMEMLGVSSAESTDQ